jgi:hypothetical protein
LLRQWAFGALLWTPSDFANATLRELDEGIRMYRKLQGMDRDSLRVTAAENEALKAKYG